EKLSDNLKLSIDKKEDKIINLVVFFKNKKIDDEIEKAEKEMYSNFTNDFQTNDELLSEYRDKVKSTMVSG
ncbi:MAG: hypothetical protein KKG64_04945, partial [Firmicutes bacterium]|nr:hypothetical protein [Bacillota bacterium]